MRERLVSYLLGELDASEAAAVEKLVEGDPALRRQLDHIRACMELDDAPTAPPEEPPTGLANRTADSVYDLVVGLSADSGEQPPASSSGEIENASKDSSRFSFVDACVAAGVFLALGMMLAPALRESRSASRRIACENNLRQIGRALHLYVGNHGGLFPHVHPGENAGVYAPRLVGDGLVDRDVMRRLIVCRSSPLGEKVACGEVDVRVPEPAALAGLDDSPKAEALRRQMGGSYSYRIGYFDGLMYCPITNRWNSRAPVMSDAASLVDGHWRSQNHGGCGQNVLCQDGSACYRVGCFLPSNRDNIFVNAEGVPAAGRRWDDAVLVRSEVTPGVLREVSRVKAVQVQVRLRPGWRLSIGRVSPFSNAASKLSPSRNAGPAPAAP